MGDLFDEEVVDVFSSVRMDWVCLLDLGAWALDGGVRGRTQRDLL